VSSPSAASTSPDNSPRRRGEARRLALAAVVATVFACAGAPPRLAEAPPAGLAEAGLDAALDPTVRGARLFPAGLDEAHGWGVEPGGGVRAIVAGVRVVSMANGAMFVASDRLAATPSSIAALPERLGGGFLFGIGPHLWRAETWLGPASALFTSSAPVAQLLVGLDRVYLRSPQGSLAGLDPRTGAPVGLGPLPASPHVGRVAALDAWRAVAIADLRGVLMTHDAGSTWYPLDLPIEPSDVVALTESIAVGGLDEARQVQWWEVRPDGRTSKFPATAWSPDRPPAPEGRFPSSSGDGPSIEASVRAFGARPLASAIEDGWPLKDGTALVARDGALARVRTSDGSLVENVAAAFPLNPARCHPLSLSFDGAVAPHGYEVGALGFVCGEPRGRTIIYRWDARNSRLVALRSFQNPRQVLGFGNGALAVRGPCTAEGPGNSDGDEQPWCVLPRGRQWTETAFPSDARLVVLADGRTLLVHPPRSDDLATAHLTVGDGARKSEAAVVFPPLHADVAHALRLGVWMDGFEERRPGVVGGWVEAAGSLLGIEIASDGQARVGEYIRDAGAPIASGRWAFGWTASRRGFETTDGGMTWAKIALPDPIASGRAVHERACGPVGCMAAGWLRVGWGTNEQAPAEEPAPRILHAAHPAPGLDLDCQPATRTESDSAGEGRGLGVSGGVSASPARGAVSELPPFGGRSGPSIPADDLGLSVDAGAALERTLLLRPTPWARIYAWGPKSGDWDPLGRWEVRWQWPWGGWQDVRSSSTAASPWSSIEAAGRALGTGPGTPLLWALVEGDDPDHALLVSRHTAGATSTEVFVLEAGRPPVQARRPSGDPFAQIEGATRIAGRWYIATAQSPGELAATVAWSLDGTVAREFARLPRAGFEARPAIRLARHTDGRAVGLVVDGQPDELLGTVERWVAGIDIESGSLGTPEPLAPVDLSDRSVAPCTGDDGGWEVDLPYPGEVRLHVGARPESPLQAPVARMIVSRERACLERVRGSLSLPDGSPPDALTKLSSSTPPRLHEVVRTVDASILVAHARRYALRCAVR
jgi:hypothetical protein